MKVKKHDHTVSSFPNASRCTACKANDCEQCLFAIMKTMLKEDQGK